MSEIESGMRENKIMIELQNVSKQFKGQPRPTLYQLNLKITPGSFCVLTGPSGAGKTTLLKLLFCEERPTEGHVFFNQKNITQLPTKHIPQVRRDIGVVFQDFKLIKHLSAFENVALALWIKGIPRDEIEAKSRMALSKVGLQSKAHILCEYLSGGEQQRVALARALVGDPALILCDEPTGNLDPKLAQEIFDILTETHKKGTTVVVATHDATLLGKRQQKILTLDQGQILSYA